MKSTVHYLLENLELQLDLQHALISLLEKKHRAVIERDQGGMEVILPEERRVVSQIRRLIDIRAAIVEKFSVRHAIPGEQRTLSGIREKFPEECRQVLDDTARSLSQTAIRIAELDASQHRERRPEPEIDRLMGAVVGEAVTFFPVKIKRGRKRRPAIVPKTA